MLPTQLDPIVWLQVGRVWFAELFFFFLIVAKKRKCGFVRKPTNETTIIHNHENNNKYKIKLKITSPAVTPMTCNEYSLCMQYAFDCLPRAFFPNHRHLAAHQAEFANLTALVIASKHAAKDPSAGTPSTIDDSAEQSGAESVWKFIQPLRGIKTRRAWREITRRERQKGWGGVEIEPRRELRRLFKGENTNQRLLSFYKLLLKDDAQRLKGNGRVKSTPS